MLAHEKMETHLFVQWEHVFEIDGDAFIVTTKKSEDKRTEAIAQAPRAP